jgi:dTDP-glucose pyrophosphorylase
VQPIRRGSLAMRWCKRWRRRPKQGFYETSIVEHVYRLAPGARENLEITDVQHVAVKRALEGLQRKGHVIGFRTGIGRNDSRTELSHHWMTEKKLTRLAHQTAEFDSGNP